MGKNHTGLKQTREVGWGVTGGWGIRMLEDGWTGFTG